jgi:uncharacterized membrane protein YdbT with pleckstrin-like domain
LAVQLASAGGLACRWSVLPLEVESGGRLTLLGEQGKAVLWMPLNGAWQLEVRSPGEFIPSAKKQYAHWNAATAALETLAMAISGQQVEPSWSEAARAVELAETIDTSLARGRTIDLHREDFTDIGTFKGTMTSVGCGLLIVGLALTVFAAIAGAMAAQMGWNQLAGVLDHWPYFLLLVCAIYLVLQLVGVLVGRSRGEENPSAPPGN